MRTSKLRRAFESQSYDSIAPWYDLLVGPRDAEIAFFASLLPGHARVIDIGCGTGSITGAMAQRLRGAGLERARVAGVDASAAVLAIARNRDPAVEWIEEDLRELSDLGPFDLALCCYNTLQCVPRAEFPGVLRRIRRQLRTGGAFAFEIYQPNYEYLKHGHADRLVRVFAGPGGATLQLREDLAFDEPARSATIAWRLAPSEPTAAPPILATTFRLFQHDHVDVVRILSECGFAVRELYGGVDRQPFSPSSKKQVFVCAAA